jgi:hypothetical protein
MKEVILITAYTPDDERLGLLIDTVNFFHSNGKDIILVTHSPNIPEFIFKKCKYYLYSSENILLDSEDSRILMFRETNDLIYGSKLVHKYKFTTLAIYNMIYLGSVIAKNLGYEILHYVEYDTKFRNLELIELASEKIKNSYESFLIAHEDGEIHGGYLSFNLNSYDYSNLIFKREELEREAKKFISTERFTRDYFFREKKIYYFPYSSINLYGYDSSLYQHTLKEKNFFVFPSFFDEKIQIVHDNQNNWDEELVVILNDNQIFKHVLNPGSFRIFPICNYEELEKITLLINNEIISTHVMDSIDLKEEILNKSTIRRK